MRVVTGEIRTGKVNFITNEYCVGTTTNTLALFGKNASGGIGFYTTETTDVSHAKMYIMCRGNADDGDGNVGIGTTSPTNKLTIKKDLNDLINAGLSLSAASKYLAKKNGVKKSEIYNLI